GDTLVGNGGGAVLNGSGGNGTVAAYGLDNLTVDLTAGTAAVSGSSTSDTLVGITNVLVSGNSDTVIGSAGSGVLTAAGTSDTLLGGQGSDTYVVSGASDVVTENTGEGTDTVLSSVTYTLGANVENLTLTGSSAINGTGNGLVNVITGNTASNTL